MWIIYELQTLLPPLQISLQLGPLRLSALTDPTVDQVEQISSNNQLDEHLHHYIGQEIKNQNINQFDGHA